MSTQGEAQQLEPVLLCQGSSKSCLPFQTHNSKAPISGNTLPASSAFTSQNCILSSDDPGRGNLRHDITMRKDKDQKVRQCENHMRPLQVIRFELFILGMPKSTHSSAHCRVRIPFWKPPNHAPQIGPTIILVHISIGSYSQKLLQVLLFQKWFQSLEISIEVGIWELHHLQLTDFLDPPIQNFTPFLTL